MTINFHEITEEKYNSINSSHGLNNPAVVVSVNRVNLLQGRSLTVIRPSETERNCTLATSNIVSSQVLSSNSQFEISPPPSPTKTKRQNQVTSSQTSPASSPTKPVRSNQTTSSLVESPNISLPTRHVKNKPTLIDYLPQNLALLNGNFNLHAIVETKFMRMLNTALLIIIAAHKTECVSKQDTTRLQFGCGFGGFEGLHSSLIPEPSLTFESNKLKKYVQDFVSHWIQNMEAALENFSRASTGRESYNYLEQLLFGPDLRLLLVFFNPETAQDLYKLVQDYSKGIEDKQSKLIAFLKKDLNENVRKDFTAEDLLDISKQLQPLKDGLNKALTDSVIDLSTNILNDTHFHYSCNAIDVLPDSFNQFDTLIENEMRKSLLVAVAASSIDQSDSVDKICEDFIADLTVCIERSAKKVHKDLSKLETLATYQTRLLNYEKPLQVLLEKIVKQLKEEEKDKSLDNVTRLKNFRSNNRALIHLYLDYIDLINDIHSMNDKNTHAQVSQSRNFLEASTKDSKQLLEDFQHSLFEEKIWFQMQNSPSPLAFLKSKFNFLTAEVSLSESETKNKMRLLTEHFRRLNDALKLKFNEADPAKILEKATSQKDLFRKELVENEPSFTTLLESSLFLLRQKSCPKHLVEQIYSVCQSLVTHSLAQDCGLLTKFIRTPYIRYIGYLPTDTELALSEPALSICYLDNVIVKEANSSVGSYLDKLNHYLSKIKEPLECDSSLDKRLSFAQELVDFLSTLPFVSIDEYPNLLKAFRKNPPLSKTEWEKLEKMIELAEDMAHYSLTLSPEKKPSTPDDYSIQLNSYIRVTYAAAKLKERLGFATLIKDFLTQVNSDESMMPRIHTESLKILNLYTVDHIATGKFFADFSRLVNLPSAFPRTEGPGVQSMGLFLQFALLDTNKFAYLAIPKIDELLEKIKTDTQKFLQPKEGKKFSISDSLLKLDFLNNHGIPTYTKILNDFTKPYLKSLMAAEIPVSFDKKDFEINKLSFYALKKQSLSSLAPWLLASIVKNKHTLFESGMRQTRVSDRMFTGVQDRFTSQIRFSARNIYSISTPDLFSKLNKLSSEQIACKIYEIIKDLKLEIDKENKNETIEFNVEVYIDYFTQ